jgi:endonuclease/exonuclease/phosphatase (EEP) superfamily protein YafD
VPSILRLLRRLFELGVVAAALACASAAIFAQGGRWNDRLDLLTHFAPVWLVGGLALAALAILVRPGWLRGLSAGLAVAAIISSASLMWMDLVRVPGTFRTAPAERPLKVIEFNTWMRNADPVTVARWLAAEKPDLIVLVEPTPAVKQRIIEFTGMHLFEGDGATIAFREEAYQSGHVASEAGPLPGDSTEFTWLLMRDSSGLPFTIVGVHCVWPIPARGAWGQDRRVSAFLATQDRPNLILAGDFNSTQWSFRQQVADAAFGVERRDIATPTWPARLPHLGGRSFPLPFLSIDHVYAGSGWRTVSVKRGPDMGSDHYPLIATFERRPGAIRGGSPPAMLGAR